MRFESRAEEILLARTRAAFEAAVDDVVDVARVAASKHSRTGKFERSITRTATVETGDALVARVGSPLSSARAKELGAFVMSNQGPEARMRFRTVEGDWVTLQAFRIPARAVMRVAGPKFPALMRARLGSAASATATPGFTGTPDTRSGRVTI